jgi:dipeptidyl aminopeptidase/acylaminoacyl peptidase
MATFRKIGLYGGAAAIFAPLKNKILSTMKTFLTSLLTLFSLSMMLTDQVQAQLPSLIDREIFFGDPEISGGQLSPDGKFISFIKPYKGTRNIWVKGTSEPFENAKPITADTTRPIPDYFWSHDSKYVLYVQDKGGNENYHVFVVDPSEKLKKGQDVPAARALTSGNNVRAMIMEVPRKFPNLIYVGLNDRDPAWHDVYQINIATGEKKLIWQNNDRLVGMTFDLDGKLRLAVRSTEDGATEILKVEDAKLTKIYECGIFEECYPIRFSKDSRKFYMVTNKTEKVDLTMLTLFNLATNAMDVVDLDPNKRVDFGNAIFSEVTDELVGTAYIDDKTMIYWKDAGFKDAWAYLEKEFPGKEISATSSTKDEVLWLIAVSSDTDPGAVYLFDKKNKKLTFQYRPRPNLPTESLATMKPYRYKSTDGLEIPAYLTLPKGVPAQNLPLIVNPHGGPWARDYWGYDGYAQFFANRGYAVLQPNFRASTGYGKKFLNAGNKEWGKKMQDDLTAGVEALVKEGIVDPKRVGIMGGSYGGYATLAGLTFTPDVYACGVSIVGPSNLFTLLKSIPAYWESIRKLFHERMGNPEDADDKKLLTEVSPLFSASKIKVPLMVVQGANDPRVKKAESDQIVVACRELGLPVEYLLAADEGHGFARPINNMAFIAAAEKFLALYLGGRYQREMKPEIEQKLKELTVDVVTVELPTELAADILTSPPPTPEKDLTPGESIFKITMEFAGTKLEMEQKTKIEDDGENWKITDNINSAMTGSMTEVSTLSKKTLITRDRTIAQGPLKVELTMSEKQITGKVNMMGQESAIEKETKGFLFADGAGSSHVMACLPLKVGYTTTFRNFDPQKQEVVIQALEVKGTEKVSVAAGFFDTFHLEVKPANGDPGSIEIWVTSDNLRKVVKTKTVVPELGGAAMIGELVK